MNHNNIQQLISIMVEFRVIAVRARPTIFGRAARKFAEGAAGLVEDNTVVLISGVGAGLEEHLRAYAVTRIVDSGLAALCHPHFQLVNSDPNGDPPAARVAYGSLAAYMAPQTWTQWFQEWFRWTPSGGGLLADPVRNGILSSPKFVDIRINNRTITFVDVPPSNYLEEQIAFMRSLAPDLLILHSSWGVRDSEMISWTQRGTPLYPALSANFCMKPLEDDPLMEFCTIRAFEGFVECECEDVDVSIECEDDAAPPDVTSEFEVAPTEEATPAPATSWGGWSWISGSPVDPSKKNR